MHAVFVCPLSYLKRRGCLLKNSNNKAGRKTKIKSAPQRLPLPLYVHVDFYVVCGLCFGRVYFEYDKYQL
jgi:hypothetical protein